MEVITPFCESRESRSRITFCLSLICARDPLFSMFLGNFGPYSFTIDVYYIYIIYPRCAKNFAFTCWVPPCFSGKKRRGKKEIFKYAWLYTGNPVIYGKRAIEYGREVIVLTHLVIPQERPNGNQSYFG